MLKSFHYSKIIQTAILFLISAVYVFLHQDKAFFWDNISQLSIPAHWYYENDFSSFFVPDEFTTGHQPFMAMYLAKIWKIFGKTIEITHWAILPFIFGFLFQLNQFIGKFTKNKTEVLLIFIIVTLDATILAQLSLITFEILHLFFLFWALNSILSEKKLSLMLSFMLLSLISLRAAMSSMGVFIFYIYYSHVSLKNVKSLNNYLVFIPGIIMLLLFFSYHYLQKGWIIHNTVSNKWANSAEFVNFKGLFYNIGIFIWRFIDFGRIGICLVFIVGLYYLFSKKRKWSIKVKLLIFIVLSQILIFFPILVVYNNTIGHRYLLPITVPYAILSILLVLNYTKHKYILYGFALLMTISGYFWLYPEKIAKGWDATPAHWPYFKLRKQAITYLMSNDIALEEVGSDFPNLSNFEYTDLSESNSSFKAKDLKNEKFILYSNIFNGFTDEELDELKTIWTEIFYAKKGNVVVKILKKTKN